MEYLLIGGAGFIGSSVIRQIGTAGVTVFDSFSPIVHDEASVRAFIDTGVDFEVGDVTSRSSIDDLFENRGSPKTLVYLAAETGTGRSLENCALNARVNTLGLANVLDALLASGNLPQRIILTSTRAVYGEGPYLDAGGQTVFPEPRPQIDLEEGRFEYEGLEPAAMDARLHMAKPINIYGSTKLSQEHLLQNWSAAFGIPLFIFRLQNVYGAGQSLTNPYTGVLIHFIKQSLAGRPTEIFENGGITRDFVHVDDVASLIAQAAKGIGEPGIFDCGSGERIELEAVAGMLANIGNAPMPVRCSDFRKGDVRHASASTARTRAIFGWEPKVELKAGLSALHDFVRQKVG